MSRRRRRKSRRSRRRGRRRSRRRRRSRSSKSWSRRIRRNRRRGRIRRRRRLNTEVLSVVRLGRWSAIDFLFIQKRGFESTNSNLSNMTKFILLDSLL